MGIRYPTDFVSRVEAEYWDSETVRDSVRRGEYVLGRYLAANTGMRMGPDQIVTAFEDGKAHHVLADAEAAVRRRKLHREWMCIMSQQLIGLEQVIGLEK